ncbi:hypothetical protein BU15DRAFT_62931 [Melanogaster broomeanus]|nr:hypothetical protein BU15DRAFT_62931 [Melanogaster broomeanus]
MAQCNGGSSSHTRGSLETAPGNIFTPVAADCGVLTFSELTTLKSEENALSQVSPPLQQPPARVLNTSLIQSIRPTIGRLLERCNVHYEVAPFDHAFYQECIEAVAQRGNPMSSSDPFSVLTYLRQGSVYAATAGAHLRADRTLQIWIGIITGYVIWEKQGNAVLDALADTLREISKVYSGSVPANLVTTSILNFVTANVIEWETRGMQILATAKQYPTYQRTLSGIGEAYAFMVFPSDLPVGQYIQAIPEMTLFIDGINDILSFYKEELAGESDSEISMIAARKGISRIEAFEELADNMGELYDRIVSILDSSPGSGAGVNDGEGDNDATPGLRVLVRRLSISHIGAREISVGGSGVVTCEHVPGAGDAAQALELVI